MYTQKRQAAVRIRAAGLLLMFLSGWLATPVKFAQPDAPSCAMECCLAQGFCSCDMDGSTHVKAEGHNHTEGTEAGAGVIEVDAVAITASCPQRCAQIPSGLRNFTAHKAAPPEYSITLSFRRLLQVRTPGFARDALLAEAHSPRAPPSSIL